MQGRVFRRTCLGHRGNRSAWIHTLLIIAGDGVRQWAPLEQSTEPEPWAAMEKAEAGVV